jgi:PTS system nitrogen regulatory IIA component
MMQLELRDAARFLGVDESTVQRWVRRGELRARPVHDHLRFDRVDLLEFASTRGIRIDPAMMAETGEADQAMPRLADAVAAGGVHQAVPGGDKAAVLREVVDRLPLPADLDRGFLHQMLMAREQLGSTGLGHGVAIPHPRNPIVLRVAAPAVSVCYLAAPIDFDALDGQPVHTLFTVVSPSVRVHLHLLAVLAAALQDAEVQQLVQEQADEARLAPALVRVEAALAERRSSSPRRGS